MRDRVSSLESMLQRAPKVRVLCVGDIMLDQFQYGDVSRISPEAPIQVIRLTREAHMLGGVGNVARNAASLGASATVVSVIGEDEAGRKILELINGEANIDPRLVVTTNRRTTVKVRFVAAGQQLLRADQEDLFPLDLTREAQLCRYIGEDVRNSDVIVLSDYAKGTLTTAVISMVCQAAKQRGIPVIADPKSSDFSKYRGVTILTPNAKELTAATGIQINDDNGAVAAARGAIQAADAQAIIVTRSEHGMTLVTDKDQVKHFKAAAREVFDVSGAGDTVISALAVGIATGAPLDEAASLANLAAGVVVGKAGTAVVSPLELTETIHTMLVTRGSSKLKRNADVNNLVRSWRDRGLRIGFTNGCFDIVHTGHISLLSQARAQCDRLVVGLNSDESVRRLKGHTRPINHELARAAVLGAIEDVDAVIIFNDDTPIELIRLIKPDVLIKGADYKVSDVVGADEMPSWGGHVVLADLSPGHSTTAIIQRAAGKNQ